jgi:hypothetical protein
VRVIAVSELEAKLQQVVETSSTRARALLEKHLTYKDGTPKFSVVRSDDSGPVVLKSYSMDGRIQLWRRAAFETKPPDVWFERVADGESVDDYQAPTRPAPKTKRGRKPKKLPGA